MPVGTLVIPNAADVRQGVGFGADGDEFVGTLVTVPAPAPVVVTGENADVVQELVRLKLKAVLPDNWHHYARRDFTILAADEFPATYTVMLPERLLEQETDNQDLIGYAAGVCLMVKEAGVKRTDPALEKRRRAAQQGVYTTNYTGLVVEDVFVEEGLDAEVPGLEPDGVTATGFTVVIGLLESREVAS